MSATHATGPLAALQTMTDASKQNNTGPWLGGPVTKIESSFIVVVGAAELW